MADFPGAEGGIRTPTGSPPAVFETAASAVPPLRPVKIEEPRPATYHPTPRLKHTASPIARATPPPPIPRPTHPLSAPQETPPEKNDPAFTGSTSHTGGGDGRIRTAE